MQLSIAPKKHHRTPEANRVSSEKLIHYQIYLINQIEMLGFEEAILYRQRFEVEFMNSIKDENLELLKAKLEKQLFAVSD